MTYKKFFAALALSSASLLGYSQTLSVTVDGIQYTVSTVTGSYSSLSSTLTRSVFYENSDLARSLSNAVAAQLPGVYGEGTGPGFNYEFDANSETFPEGLALTWVYITGPGPQDLPMVVADSGEDMVWALAYLAGPSTEDTLTSMRLNALALRQAFNQQSALMNIGLSQDCTVFDEKNLCASFTGTRSTQSGSNMDATVGTLVLAHRTAANFRYGAYINQNLNTSNQGGLRLERSTPGVGAFANYTLGSDLNIRGSIGFGKLDMESTREAIGTAEAGVGKSHVKSHGVQIELNKAFDINPDWAAIPYGGVRKTTTKRAGYSEAGSATVTTPLTYAELKQTQTTAFGGVRFLGNIAPQTHLLLSAGFEHDMSSKIDDYAAAGVAGLGSMSMQGDAKKTRPVFSAAVSYDIAKNERASISVQHRQEAFDSKAITSVGLTYIKGF